MTQECTPKTEAGFEAELAAKLSVPLKALAEPIRLMMISAVAGDPRGESCVCDLVELTGLTQPTVSHHLKVLRDAGLLLSERRGTWVWYRIAPARVAAVTALLETLRLFEPKPSVLFVCVHNAGRSQMAAGYLQHLGRGLVEVRSAGSMPATEINPVAIEVMREEGIDITGEHPKILTTETVQGSDVVITMGCGDACPFFPGKRYEDWELEDPAGQEIDAVRGIRNQIKMHVEELLSTLMPA